MIKIIAHAGQTLDEICHLEYGRTYGVTETVLEANPHLRTLGPALPVGTVVELPPAPPAPELQIAKFWG